MQVQNFTKNELVAIYLQLNPNQRYLGDEPSAWTRDTLIRLIVRSLTVPVPQS